MLSVGCKRLQARNMPARKNTGFRASSNRRCAIGARRAGPAAQVLRAANLFAASPLPGKPLKYLHTDSWEVENVNRTPMLPAEFRKQCGYDMVPWLPVIASRAPARPDGDLERAKPVPGAPLDIDCIHRTDHGTEIYFASAT